MQQIPIIVLSIFAAVNAQADVQIEFKNSASQSSRISSNSRVVRIDDGQLPGYVLVNYETGEFIMVDSQRKQAMTSSIKDSTGAQESPAIAIKLKDLGSGSKIAGYASRRYQILADGQNCGTVDASAALFKQEGIRKLYDSMNTMQQQLRQRMGGMAGMLDLCARANLQLAASMPKIGAALRIVDAKGTLQMEVTGVKTALQLSSQLFQVPEGMKVVSVDQKMKEAAAKTQEMIKTIDFSALLKQMQQSGVEITPEMQKQMEAIMPQMQQ
ncbi:MAG: hypothetical protein ACI9LO_001297 [Planctomycetota bacterium]|jgi:hypothetical protein